MYDQVAPVNLSTAGNVGYCLAFAESAFNAPHIYPYAYTAWENAQFKHADQNFPDGVDVPIWFSYMVGDINEGHVAIRLANGTVLSSPWQAGTTQAILPSIAELERIYSDNGVHPLVYLGWTEDIGGKRVVQPAPPPAPSYTITNITPQQFMVKSGMKEWNLSLNSFTDISNNPVTTAGDNVVITCVATLVRNDLPQYTYYLENAANPVGWNSLDLVPYTPPAPPAPYVPPAAPVQVNKAEKYDLVTTVMYFATEPDSAFHRDAKGTLSKGSYYVWDKRNKSINLSDSNMKDKTQWVNMDDNVDIPSVDTTNLSPPEMDKPTTAPNPVPAATVDTASMNWRGTIDLRYAGMYVFYNHNKEHDPNANTVSIIDLETGNPLIKNGTPVTPSNGQYAQISGKVKWTDGNWYGRLKDSTNEFHWYAARIEDLIPYNEVYGTQTSLQERQALHTLSTFDRIELGIAKIKSSAIISIGRNLWDIVAPKKGKK